MKNCNGCKQDKPLNLFGKDKSNKDGLLYTCKNCRRNLRRKNRIKNPEFYKKEYESQRKWRIEYDKKPEVVRRRRNKRLKYVFGITIEDYEKILKMQNGNCKICMKPETLKKNMYLAVDHCHKTGKIRGLLCNRCNRVLGLMQENTEYFTNSIKYLEENK